jgi:chorismate synthase
MNTFGKNFRVTTFGESHGVALGAVIDGCPSQITLNVEGIQKELDRRKPGQSAITTQRKEGDKAEILSGVFEDKTLGSPIAVVVFNQDQQSRDYDNVKHLYRPGHADEAWDSKFGFRDYRGGGRSSGRETLSRVIGGAIAKQVLAQVSSETKVIGHVVQIADIQAENFDLEVIEKNPVRCADAEVAKQCEEAIMQARSKGESLGGVVEVLIQNCPQNLGEPVFGKLSSRLAEAIMSIGTVHSFEVMPANECVTMKGSESNQVSTGISGGFATGEDIILRFTVKPTPSVAVPQKMKTKDGGEEETVIHGRHDPCLPPRVVPVAEAMVSMVLLDLLMEDKMRRF